MSEENCSLCGGTKNVIRLNLFGGSRDEHCTGNFYLCENCAKICKKCDCIIPTDDIKQLLESWREENGWEEIGSLDLCECELSENNDEVVVEKTVKNKRLIDKIVVSKWLKTFDEMQKEITHFIIKIFDKYAVFVFSTVFFLWVAYYAVLIGLELIHEHIIKLPILEYKPYYGYIYAFPDASRAKNYRLKFKKLEDGFYLFFPNGGSKYFEYCEEFNNKGELFGCETENDTRDWHFRYYNEE